MFRVLQALSWLLSLLSVHQRTRIGILLGRATRAINSKRYKTTVENIRLAYPQYTLHECELFANEAYKNLGIVYVEIFASPFLSDESIINSVSVKNLDVVKQAYNKNKGVVFVTAHTGNWEWASFVAGIVTQVPILGVAKKQRNHNANALLNSFRMRANNSIVEMDKAARPIFSALAKNQGVGILLDQAADPTRDVFVNFFGRPCATFEAPATIVFRTGSPLVLATIHREENNTYTMQFKEIDYSAFTKDANGRKQLIQLITTEIEQHIRCYPTQWTWQHKRWKYNPSEYNHEH